MRNSNLYYIYTDHLNTPRAITDIANNMQWVWENKEAFGNNTPTEIISGFKFNLRFPGQYFDNETNLNYNIHRDYNPVWGRYTTSDPLGLAAGINTYGYVGGNSLGLSDKLGLKPVIKENCDALMKLIDYERSNPYFIFGRDKKYHMLSFEVDTLNLNASFESIGGKVDIDWMLRVSVVPGLYYIAKPAWNVANNVIGVKNSKYRFTPFIGMNEEGHRNAPGAAMFYLIHKGDGMTMEKMFKPAIDNCKCMLNK